MNYREAVKYMDELGRYGSKPGLDRLRILASRLGNPQDKLKFIHISGTNGKGSTAAFLAGILKSAGYTTGMYTSPFILRINEQVRINGQEISDDEFAQYVTIVKAAADKMADEGLDHPTQFEVLTAMSFLYFYEKMCGVVILEAGMGGRLDATNIITESLVSVITKISFDHMDFLGNTLPKIAYEKAGIIKQGGNVVLYPQEEEALDTIKEVAKNLGAEIFYTDPKEITNISIRRGQLSFMHRVYGKLQTSVTGVHQVNNAAVAIKTVEVLNNIGFTIEREAVVRGFNDARWPGRFELISTEPDFYIDGGHNPDGIRSLVETFKIIYPGKKASIIIGVFKDKDFENMAFELSTIAKRFIAVTPGNPRALPAENLAGILLKYCKNVEYNVTIKEAVEKILSSAPKDEIIIATGSLSYIGQVRNMFKKFIYN